MKDSAVETSPLVYARVGGWLYLLVIVTGVFGLLFVQSRLVVSGGAAATAKNIMASESLWRLGFVSILIGSLGYVAITAILYVLLRPTNRNISLIAAFFSLTGCAIGSVAALGDLAPVYILGGADYLKAVDPHQLQALAYLSIKFFGYGTDISIVLFGIYCFLIGYLIFKSGYFPKFIGVLLIIGSFCYLINSFADFLSPAFAAWLPAAILIPPGIAELSLCLWLIVMGVNVPKWNEKANRLAS